MGILNFMENENVITINGKTIKVKGNNVSVVNNKVIVDGKVVEEGLDGIVKIEWTGDLAKLNCNTAEIHGNVHGDVDCNTLYCGDIQGDVDSNTVHCGNIGGNVEANVVHRK